MEKCVFISIFIEIYMEAIDWTKTCWNVIPDKSFLSCCNHFFIDKTNFSKFVEMKAGREIYIYIIYIIMTIFCWCNANYFSLLLTQLKSKVAAKTGGLTYQWEIMQALELEDEEIKKYDLIHCTFFLLSSMACVNAFISMGTRVGAVHSGENTYMRPVYLGFHSICHVLCQWSLLVFSSILRNLKW